MAGCGYRHRRLTGAVHAPHHAHHRYRHHGLDYAGRPHAAVHPGAGLSAKTPDGAGAFSCPIIFPPFISSAFVPTNTMPGPVRAFAGNQPVTSIVNTIRDLIAQKPVSGSIWTGLAWCLGVLVLACPLAMVTCHRQIA
jgi:hypothetical protein